MSVSPQAVQFPRLQPGRHEVQEPRSQGISQLISIDSPSSLDTVVHIVCSDAVQVRSLVDFFLSHSIGVHVFGTGAEYMTNAESEQIACLILDLNLPDISGLEVQRRISEREGPPVVFVTACGDLNSGVRAMKNGAIDFMIEPFDPNRLLGAVEAGFARARSNRYERIERSDLLRRWHSLTPREQEVFRHTVAGFLNKQAAAELGITENTFQVHRGRVMRKMKADSLADLVRMSTRLEPFVPCVIKSEDPGQARGTVSQTHDKDKSQDINKSPAMPLSGVKKIATFSVLPGRRLASSRKQFSTIALPSLFRK